VPQLLASLSDSAGEGFPRISAAVVTDARGIGDGGRSLISNSDADTPLWRTAIHEGSHILASRFQNLEVAGSTLVGGAAIRD
jgi:hypothetical protein